MLRGREAVKKSCADGVALGHTRAHRRSLHKGAPCDRCAGAGQGRDGCVLMWRERQGTRSGRQDPRNELNWSGHAIATMMHSARSQNAERTPDTDGTRSALWAAVHRTPGPTACSDCADDCGDVDDDDDDENRHNTYPRQ